MWRSGLIGIVLAAGCTLDSTPDASSEATRAPHESPAWQPDTLHASIDMHAASAGSDAPAGDHDEHVSGAAGTNSDPVARTMTTMRTAAGTGAKADAGSGGGGHGGSAGSAILTSQPSAAGAPAAGSGGAASESGSTHDDPDLGSALIEVAIGILTGASDFTLETAGGIFTRAATAGGLTASLVGSVLESLTSTGICVLDPEPCQPVCDLIARDCRSCADDDSCREEMRTMCGEQAAACVER